MNRIFVDTSAWFAYSSSTDKRHAQVVSALERWRGRLVTSNFIFDEIVTLVRGRAGLREARIIGQLLRDNDIVELVHVLGEDEEEAWTLFSRYQDKPFSFTDCTSFAIMKRLGLDTALSTDDDFRLAGFQLEP